MTPRFGLVEGFYGPPWSHAARVSMLGFAASYGATHYVWAPKNDPSHRSRWAEPPSASHLAETAELVALATSLDMTWVYGLSPVLSRGRTARDRGAVTRRLRPLLAAGVRTFVLAFDDTWATLTPRLASAALGRQHGALVRDVAAALSDESGACEVWCVPAIYSGTVATLPAGALHYLEGIAEAAPETFAAWTGPGVFSSWIRGQDARALSHATGLRLWVWSNAIANDWLPMATGLGRPQRGLARLAGGPPENLAPDVADATSLVVLNGAREPELSKPHFACLAAWATAPRSYRADDALRRALDQVFGSAGPVVGELLALQARHALSAPARADDTPGDRPGLERVASLPGRLREALADHPARLEVFGAARKAATLARAGLAALDGLASDTRSARRAALRRSEQHLAAARAQAWDVDERAVVAWLTRLDADSRRR